MSRWSLFNILVAIILFSGCSARKDLAPVIDHRQPPSTKVSYHVVAPGETLYSIAWRYNLDYKSLAKANKIGRGYRIYPGQKIHLRRVQERASAAKLSSPAPLPKKKIIQKTNTQVAKTSATPRLKNKPQVVVKRPASKKTNQKLQWSWPAKGKILQRFKSKNGLNKGIDIGGELGEPVHAASSGTVVYSGEGLRGYGKLIIIKHSEKYLSAYAHNHRLLVKEGDTVVRNEKIAEMGKTGSDKVNLHFEIRYDGLPIDPVAYLPPR